MDSHRLVKAIYQECKRRTVHLKGGSLCYSTHKILVDLKLEHLWESEQIGAYKDWVSFAVACVKRRDTEEWEEGLKKGDKLRWYRQIKSELKREDYLSWVSQANIVCSTQGSAVVHIG